MTSYAVNTKSKGKKNVLVLSTLPLLMGVTKDDGKDKPAIIKLYNFTKIGTDISDQINAHSTTKTCSPKWTRTGFSYMLDMSQNNVMVIFALNKCISPKKVNTFNFTIELAKSLIQPFLEERNTSGLNSPVLAKRKSTGVGSTSDLGPARKIHPRLGKTRK